MTIRYRVTYTAHKTFVLAVPEGTTREEAEQMADDRAADVNFHESETAVEEIGGGDETAVCSGCDGVYFVAHLVGDRCPDCRGNDAV